MVRINELFDIIKEFPESTPAIEDLKMCITSGRQRNHLVNVFRQAYPAQLILMLIVDVRHVCYIPVQIHWLL